MQVYRELHVLTARPSEADEASGAASPLRHGVGKRSLFRRPLAGRRRTRPSREAQRTRAACRSWSAAPASISRRSPRDSRRSPTSSRECALIGASEAERLGRRGTSSRACGARSRHGGRAQAQRPAADRARARGDRRDGRLARRMAGRRRRARCSRARRLLRLVIAPEREPLYAAIDARFDRMIENGAIEEVRGAAGARSRRRPSRRCGPMACASSAPISPAPSSLEDAADQVEDRVAAATPSGR